MAQTLQERRDQFHTLRLGEYLDPFNPAVQSFIEQAQARFLQQTGGSGCCPAASVAGTGEPTRTAVIGTGVFRLFFPIRCCDACADGRRFCDESSVAEKGTSAGGE